MEEAQIMGRISVSEGTRTDKRTRSMVDLGEELKDTKKERVELAQTDASFWRPGHEELLPGLPDDIVFYHIVPELTWRDIFLLAKFNRRWREAIQSNQVVNARVFARTHQRCLTRSLSIP